MKKFYIIMVIIVILICGVFLGYHIYNQRYDNKYDSIKYQLGTSFYLNGEKFYIFDYDSNSVTGLAAKCINIENNKQSEEASSVSFSLFNYWKTNSTFPSKIETDEKQSPVFRAVSDYAKNLNKYARGTLLTLNQYNRIIDICNSPIWLNDRNYWLRTAYSNNEIYVVKNKTLNHTKSINIIGYCVRPVIQIDKKYLDD